MGGSELKTSLMVMTLTAGLFASSCNGFVGEWMILDGFGERFASVGQGQTEDEVIAALGLPARESSTLTLPQREGYEALFQEATDKRALRFLYWDTGVDEVAVIGLDDQNKVAFKCRAGT